MRLMIAGVLALLVLPLGALWAPAFGAIYSNLAQETEYETYDCAGYTVRIVKNPEGQTEVYFTPHEGNCEIKGEKVKELSYQPNQGVLSFTAPFEASTGAAYYRFKGRILKNRLEGRLSIEYPSDPKFNKVEKLVLRKTTEERLFKKR